LPLFKKGRSGSRSSLTSFHYGGGSLDSAPSTNFNHSHSIQNTLDEGLASIPGPITVNKTLSIPSLEEKRLKISSLRDELDTINTLYLTSGSNKEINIPDKIRKKIILEV